MDIFRTTLHHHLTIVVCCIFQLCHLILAHFQLLKLLGKADHLQDVRFVHHGVQQLLIKDLNSVVLHIEVAGCSAQVAGGEVLVHLVEPDHLRLVKIARCVCYDFSSLPLKGGVFPQLLVLDSITLGILAHSHKQIRVAEPLDSLLHIGHCTQ